MVATRLDERQRKHNGRKSETRILWGLCTVFCKIHSGDAGSGNQN